MVLQTSSIHDSDSTGFVHFRLLTLKNATPVINFTDIICLQAILENTLKDGWIKKLK